MIHYRKSPKYCYRSPSVREETTSDLEMESAVWRESFELTGEEKLETADLAIQEEVRLESQMFSLFHYFLREVIVYSANFSVFSRKKIGDSYTICTSSFLSH